MANKPNISLMGKVARILIPIMLILSGGAAWSYFQTTAPVMERVAPQRQVFVVEVQTARQGKARTMVSAMGTVVAAREVTLKSQVAGVVRSVADAYVPGGLVDEGAELLVLDPADYEVAVKKAESALADAKAALAIEQGNQNIAREELRLLSELSPEAIAQTDLALRKPHLQQAQAAIASAEADLRQAKLNLSRTVIHAPFNAMIVDRNVNVGTYAGTQEDLTKLVGTDEFWVEAVVSLDQLSLIDRDYPGGCPVIIRSQAGGGRWEGRVIQIAGQLNASSRMATVIVSVQNPLGTIDSPAFPRLMIDDYVHVDITGRELGDVIELPRTALRDNNTVWVNRDDTLDIREVTLAWKSTDKVYLQSGVSVGEQVVLSDLATPVQGMPLKTTDDITDTAANTAN